MAFIPKFSSHFPALYNFIQNTSLAYQAGEFLNEDHFSSLVRGVFPQAEVDRIDLKMPGWAKMVRYAGGRTMVHVITTLIALRCMPEYGYLTPAHQEMMDWVMFCHDLGKEVIKDQRDHYHPNLSAAITARNLPALGFRSKAAYPKILVSWEEYTIQAKIEENGEIISDGRKYAHIIRGIEAMFGENTPASLILKAVLLHQSLNILSDWPQAAPLTETQVKEFLTPALFPLAAAAHLADSDSWQMFEEARKEAYHQEINQKLDQYKKIAKSS